jgi:hypothetical protein
LIKQFLNGKLVRYQNFSMKRLTPSFSQPARSGFGSNTTSSISSNPTKGLKMPKIKINMKWVMRIMGIILAFVVVIMIIAYFFVVRPMLNIAAKAQDLKDSTYTINHGLKELNFTEVKEGLDVTKRELAEFEEVYEKNMGMIRHVPGTEAYYQDSQHMLSVAEQGIELGELTVSILEPHAADLGFSTNGVVPDSVPAQERVMKLIKLMPQFSSKVGEISDKMQKIDDELAQIDASRYPTQLPGIVSQFGVDPSLNLREQILAMQSISSELASKAPQFESFFNAVPDFMGLNAPKRYLILMANNYELRMSGGFNTYVIVAEFNQGVPQITYSIDTYFIDEGDRTGSSNLVSRNVPYFLGKYLYIQDRGARLYARDATSTNADFPLAANTFLTEFWNRDRSLPQQIDGVIQINNDIAVDILKVVGPVNTEKYSIRTDSGGAITIPNTEFNSDNVIENLESIAGGKLAETIGRKEIIKFLGQSILEKIFNSEATNLVNITKVMLDSMSKKDIILYSFDANVEKAFQDLGYGGKIIATPEGSDYLHVNRSNFGSGKADWTKEGFVTQNVYKNVETKDGKKISTVKVTIHNPKRPDWYNIDPCCFYKGYLRVYAPAGSKMVSVTASDGQDAHGAEYQDDAVGKSYFESYTIQPKETDLDVTFVYELPATVNTDDYKIVVQRQSGASIDDYTIGLNGVTQDVLLNSDKNLQF